METRSQRLVVCARQDFYKPVPFAKQKVRSVSRRAKGSFSLCWRSAIPLRRRQNRRRIRKAAAGRQSARVHLLRRRLHVRPLLAGQTRPGAGQCRGDPGRLLRRVAQLPSQSPDRKGGFFLRLDDSCAEWLNSLLRVPTVREGSSTRQHTLPLASNVCRDGDPLCRAATRCTDGSLREYGTRCRRKRVTPYPLPKRWGCSSKFCVRVQTLLQRGK